MPQARNSQAPESTTTQSTDSPGDPAPTAGLLSFDIDGTLLGKTDATLDFAATWEALPAERRPVLVYNTGRLSEDARRTIAGHGLPDPDFLISGVGTSVEEWKSATAMDGFSGLLDEGWDRDRVDSIVSSCSPATPQPEACQTPVKSSWFWHNAPAAGLEDLRTALEAAGLRARVVYSSSRDLDIIPRHANKGNALEWLCNHLGISTNEVIVAGDTGNDSTMFHVDGVRGILVENAEPELIATTLGGNHYLASSPCAEGVLEGLLHYGVFGTRRRAQARPAAHTGDPRIARLFAGESPHKITAADFAEMRETSRQALAGLRRCITPWGFASWPTADSESGLGNDGAGPILTRDGLRAVIDSLPVADDDIRSCQRATLETLLTHTASCGLVPEQVSNGRGTTTPPGTDTAGSRETGMWLVIAIHQYVNVTGDLALIQNRHAVLARVMARLDGLARDASGLLEIPQPEEDSPSLFGPHSVVTREVLYYRSLIAWARLQERIGHADGAHPAIERAEQVKRSIHRTLWQSPSKSPPDRQGGCLAHTGVPPGASQCDVTGNLLAFLFNAIDFEKARTTLILLWNAGVNAPFPVASTCSMPTGTTIKTTATAPPPPLQSQAETGQHGTINPWTGALWVRFLLRLGLRDIALGEMLKLARLNRQGIANEWEFNECAHGTTGLPKGRPGHATACAGYLRAWHEFTHHH